MNDSQMRRITLTVDVITEYSDKIISDWDDNGEPIEYTDGYILKVLPQEIIWDGRESRFVASVMKTDKHDS